MVGIKKTDEERKRIQQFTNAMRDILGDEIENVEDIIKMEVQTWFNAIKDELYDPKGSLYLCFQCGGLIDRKDMSSQTFFQVERLWHDCLGSISGAVYPTAGLPTYWHRVIEYLDKKGI